MSPLEILAKAATAAKAQPSVRMAIDQGTASGSAKTDASVSKSNGASGTVSANGETVQFYATKANVWVKAAKEFWTKNASPAAAEMIGNKWVKAPVSNKQFAAFAAFGDYTVLFDEVMEPTGAVSKGELTEVNGQKAIILVSDSGQLWIATTGDPLPLQMKGKPTEAGSGTVTFSQWGSAKVGSAPPDSDSIDLDKLK